MGNFDHRVSLQVYLFSSRLWSLCRMQTTWYRLVRFVYLVFQSMNFTLSFVTSEGGFFQAILSFPLEFPLLPPKLRFKTPMWHPNSEHIDCNRQGFLIIVSSVYEDGTVCISILVGSHPILYLLLVIYHIVTHPACSRRWPVWLRGCRWTLDACSHSRIHCERV